MAAEPVSAPIAAPDQALPFFVETGFRIANERFADYFNKCGGLRTFGYPVSRAFQFLGTEVQFFQRHVMPARTQMPWVGAMFVWNLNFPAVTGLSPNDEKVPFGIVNRDWSPRPAYRALQTMPK